MPADFELDEENRIIHSRAWGRVAEADLFAHMAKMKELVDAGLVDSTWAQVWDFSDAEDLHDVSTSGVQRMAERNPWPSGAIRVVIAPRDVEFGLVRMYQGLGDPSAVAIVRSAAEAAAFIARERSGR